MAFYHTAVRTALRPVTRLPVPGRYQLVELLRPLIVPQQKVTTRTTNNVLFELDLHDLIQRQIYFDLYDQAEVQLLRQLIKPGDVVFDIGSNIGYYAMNLASVVGATGNVHVFEPVPRNVAALRRNIALNHFEERVVINPVAVAAQAGQIELFLPTDDANTGWASIVATESRPERLSVEAVTLDAYVERVGIKHVRLIKIDIEGAELQAFQGMYQLLAREDAPMIYFEINPFLLEKQQLDPRTVKHYLAERGYKLFELKHNQLVPVAIDMRESSLCNILATKQPAAIT